ncbi:hypothetical protein [Microbulbifer variabilis]|uniref:hypothetical protein n=1 Tax=Microbulbifer variabilis TaxID=266805 RepID=UPI001CFE4E77|nr:hypothetical protein [Microbulbifer variabilis]
MTTIYQAIVAARSMGISEAHQIDETSRSKTCLGKICERISKLFSRPKSIKTPVPKPNVIEKWELNIHHSGRCDNKSHKIPTFSGRCQEFLKATKESISKPGYEIKVNHEGKLKNYGTIDANSIRSRVRNLNGNVVAPLIIEVRNLMSNGAQSMAELKEDVDKLIYEIDKNMSTLDQYEPKDEKKKMEEKQNIKVFLSVINETEKLLKIYDEMNRGINTTQDELEKLI